MPRPRARPLSASRQRRHSHRRSSLNGEMRASETTIDLPPSPVIISGVDYRPLKEKITELQRKFEQQKDDSTVFSLQLTDSDIAPSVSLVRRTSAVAGSHATVHQPRIRRSIDGKRPSLFKSDQVLSRSAK